MQCVNNLIINWKKLTLTLPCRNYQEIDRIIKMPQKKILSNNWNAIVVIWRAILF